MSSNDSFIVGIVNFLSEALQPLKDAAASNQVLDSLFVRLGWPAPSGLGMENPLLSTAAEVEQLVADVNSGASVFALLSQVEKVFHELDELRSRVIDSSMPAPFDDAGFWQSFPQELAVLLLCEALENSASGLYGVMAILGVVQKRLVPADESAGRSEYLARRIELSNASRLVSSPADWFSRLYGWNDSFDYSLFLSALASLGAGVNAMVAHLSTLSPPFSTTVNDDNPQRGRLSQLVISPFQPGTVSPNAVVKTALVATPLPPSENASEPPNGVLLSLLVIGVAQARMNLPGNIVLTLTGDFQTSPIQFGIRLTGVTIESGQSNIDIAADLEISPQIPILLGGTENGIRVELKGAHLSMMAQGTATDLEFKIDAGLDEANVILDFGGADSFLRGVIGAGPYQFSLPFGFTWSNTQGLQFSGNTLPEIHIPMLLKLGPLLLTEATVQLATGGEDEAFVIQIAVDGALLLGSFNVTFYGLGLQAQTRSASLQAPGNFGLLDIYLGIKEPNSIAFSIESETINGGGLLYIEDDRYIGALNLSVLEIGIDALTIIDTSLPNRTDGYAIFASLSLRFPSIPLGFGFSLSGLGGVLGLNRGVDGEALAFGLRDGAVDAILFPEDPVRDADILINQLDEYFPIIDGNTIVGPVAEISWGTPALITGQLGIAISLPEGVIVVLGSILSILPDPNYPILELHLDILGEIDGAEGTLLVVGSLYDSRLLGVIELSGDAAVYMSVVDNPYFLLSVGGFHPGFQPPAYVPSILESLRRMRAEVLVGLGVTANLESYFAVTSNTVQVGGKFELEAAAEFLGVTYTAKGWFDFDILLRFNPFLIITDASAGVGVFAENKEITGVNLSVHLEGVDPWYATGNASFKFFFVKVKFQFTVGGHTPAINAPTSDVLKLMAAELENPTAWTIERGTGIQPGIVLRASISEELVRPDDFLAARQTVAPMDYTLDRFGETTPVQKSINIESAKITFFDGEQNIDFDEVNDWFASA